MRKLQSQGVHHITLVGADRQTSIDFWEGVLGMPFVFEQPNLDNAAESHLYFDPGDGRLITVFTNEERTPDPRRTPTDPGCVHIGPCTQVRRCRQQVVVLARAAGAVMFRFPIIETIANSRPIVERQNDVAFARQVLIKTVGITVVIHIVPAGQHLADWAAVHGAGCRAAPPAGGRNS